VVGSASLGLTDWVDKCQQSSDPDGTGGFELARWDDAVVVALPNAASKELVKYDLSALVIRGGVPYFGTSLQ
jgi:hypothetical protein